jgi:hypothetical protein
MTSRFDDVREISKPTKKMQKLLDEKGSYASEFSFEDMGNFAEIVQGELVSNLLDDFDGNIGNSDPVLIRFYIYDSVGDGFYQKLYLFNPEGFYEPTPTAEHLKDLVNFILKDYDLFTKLDSAHFSKRNVGFEYYPIS